jgi:predicted AlkP superfamily phosphohydrolase/phosphomutase
MMKRVLVIGIDALDSVTISKLANKLPALGRLKRANDNITFDGVFPPDSPTSWASIYTGLDPAKHGIVLFVDPLNKAGTMITKEVNDNNIRGKTFWDIAGHHGKKVCIMPHLLGYPVWPVNGIMIGRSGITRDVQCYPKELTDKYELSQFEWRLNLFPGRNINGYIKKVKEQVDREMGLALRMLSENDWDLFFVSFGELDVIQYSLWNYYDEKDPSYPGKNIYGNLIPEFYEYYDNLIQTIFSAIDLDTVVIIVSDHGIGSRPVKLININELLRRQDILKCMGNHQTKKRLDLLRLARLKKLILNVVNKYQLGNIGAVALRFLPKGKEWFISSQIDWNKSLAYLTDQSGIKNYPYGGIMIVKNNLADYSYDTLRERIMQYLSEVTDPDNGQKIVNWILKREDLYRGDYLGNYPDIVFELDDSYGAGIETPAHLFGKSLSHAIVPGCHKQHHATFLISGVDDRKIMKNHMNLMDVSPTILDLLGIDSGNYNFDGSSIFGGK